MNSTMSEAEWVQLLEPITPEQHAEATRIYQAIRDHYQGRSYHNFEHITEMLGNLAAVENLATDLRAIKLAIIFHDIIYKPGASDNEEQSAKLAKEILGERLGMEPSHIIKVEQLIMATNHQEKTDDPDSQLIADLDLLGLSKPYEEFKNDTTKVRQEFPEVVDAAFALGNSEFLNKLAKRGLYQTAHFQSHEEQAKANISRLIAERGI